MNLSPDHAAALKARQQLLRCVLRAIAHDYDHDDYAHYSDEGDYADDEMAKAARDYAEEVEKLPADVRPVGWRRRPVDDSGGDDDGLLELDTAD